MLSPTPSNDDTALLAPDIRSTASQEALAAPHPAGAADSRAALQRAEELRRREERVRVALQANPWHQRQPWRAITQAYRNVRADDDAKATDWREAKAGRRTWLRPYRQAEAYNGNEVLDVEVEGLYWCLTLAGPAPPKTSPYGQLRYTVPLSSLLNRLTQNLYLLNIYHTAGKESSPYVILAVAGHSTAADERCRQLGLEQLDWEENAYLRLTQTATGQAKYCYANSLWLELFIAAGVFSSPDWLYSDTITVTGRRTATAAPQPA